MSIITWLVLVGVVSARCAQFLDSDLFPKSL